ncbi:MAG: hypothetical protein ABI073_05870 [Luteolibacter sp.]
MNIRNFVSGSSVILAGWLGATFLNEVPAQRYPKLDKASSAIPRIDEKIASVTDTKPSGLTSSVAH